jgi:AraC-like DNA-binding protein
VKSFEVKHEKSDILPMQDGLSLGFAHLFEVTSSLHVLAEHATSRIVRHDEALCLLFVVHGSLQMDCVETHISLGSDEVFLFVPRGSVLFSLSYEKGVEFYLLQFRRPRQAAGAPRRTLEVPEHVGLGNPGRLTHLVRMFMEESRRTAGSRLILHHLLVLMLCELARCSQLPAGTNLREDGRENMASRVDAYIAAHYHETIGTPDIAAELRYNPDYLERAYRLERHMSIRDAIHARRIREVRAQLLLQRAVTVAEIAAQCGYSDAGSFRRVFKRETSMTPHDYRLINASQYAAGINASRHATGIDASQHAVGRHGRTAP